MSDTDPDETLDANITIFRQQREEVSTEAAFQLDCRAYTLAEELGRGGMGEVYCARDPALGRDLAIKVMKAQFNGITEAEQRFLREARVTGLLQHPGIVPVHNLGRLPDGRLHYTMRLVRGRTFAGILKDEAGKPERLPALLGIFEKICQAVAFAHSKRVIHRDLKPANVMVGKFGEVQVMDWGLAKALTAEGEPAGEDRWIETEGAMFQTDAGDTPAGLTRAGSSLGTPAYMSPEQALGEWDTVDERSDVFALGAILCEILIGRPPYTGRDGNEVLRRARRIDMGEALAQLEKCPADEALRSLCRHCLSPEPKDRPRDAGEVAMHVADYDLEVQERLRRAELERVAAETRAREEQARAIVERERAKAERRAKRRMQGLAVMMVAFLGLGIFTSWWIVKAREESAKAREERAKELLERQKLEAQEREADNYWNRGKNLYQKGLVKEAIVEFREAIRAKSDYAPAHNFLGVALAATGQYEEAIASYRRSIASDVTFSFPHVNLGIALKKKGDVEGAIDAFKNAIELDPTNAAAHDNLAHMLSDKGQLDEAIAEYREATRLQPEEEVFFYRLANCLRKNGQLDEAIKAYREAIRIEPDDGDFYSSLGEALDEKGQLDEAVAEYHKAVEHYKQAKDGATSAGMSDALALLGADLLRLRKYAEAESALRDCLAIRQKKEADEWTTYNTSSQLGEALLAQKKYTQAEPMLVQAYEGLKQREAKIPEKRKDRLTKAAERLVLLYVATDQKSKADQWRERVEETKSQEKRGVPQKTHRENTKERKNDKGSRK